MLYPSIEPNNAVAHIIHELLPVGVKGIAMAALIGISMSSLDSLLHTAGLTMVHDVIKPILDFKRIAINELRWIRWATVLVSIIAINIGLYATDSFKLLLTALAFQAPTILVPLLAGIMGLKVDKRYFYTALLCTLASFLATKLYLPATYDHCAILIHIAVNAVAFWGMHLIQHRGFVMVNRSQDTSYLWQPVQLSVITSIRSMLPTPRRIVTYSQKKVEKYGAPYILFGVFISMLYTIPYFLWSYTPLRHQSIMLMLRLIGGILCALLIVRDKWFLPYLPTFWHCTLLYCLPFTSTVMFLLTQGSVEWLINVALTIMFLIVLVDWMSFIILTSLGVTLGFFFYQTAIGPLDLQLDFSTGYLLVYTCLFSTLIALLFSRRKEQHLEAKLREISEHYYSTKQLAADVHPATLRIAAMIERQVQEVSALYHQPSSYDTVALQKEEPHTDPDFLQYFFPTALEVIKQGNQLNQHLVRVIMTDGIAPHLSLFSLQACVAAILEAYQNRHPQSMHVDLSEDYRIYTSFNHLQYALIHVLRFLQAHHLGDQVRIWTTRKEGIHPKKRLSIWD